MKKVLFLMLFLTSCRSLTMEDYQTNISPFKYQDYEFTLNVPDNIYVITQTNVGERAKIDSKQEHLKTVAYDVNSEIINKLGNDDNSIGSIIISQDVLNRKQGTLMTLLGSFPSILSLGTLNLIGYPSDKQPRKNLQNLFLIIHQCHSSTLRINNI